MGYSYKDRNGFAIHIHSNYERKPLKMAAGQKKGRNAMFCVCITT